MARKVNIAEILAKFDRFSIFLNGNLKFPIFFLLSTEELSLVGYVRTDSSHTSTHYFQNISDVHFSIPNLKVSGAYKK